MSDDPAGQIADRHSSRHDHYEERNVSRCKHCSAFVTPEEQSRGVVQYNCWRCGVVTETRKQAISRLSRAWQYGKRSMGRHGAGTL